MKKIITLLAFAICLNAGAQIITTVAGNGGGGYSGDGGYATSAMIQGTFGLAVDVKGNIFISDYWHHVIRKVNTSGIINTIAGNGIAGYTGDNGVATSAEINSPQNISADIFGNIYFADGIGVIRKVNTSGIISTVAGNGTTGYTGDGGQATAAELNAPVGVAIDTKGILYIADEFNNRIRKVNTQGIISTIAGTGNNGFSGDGGQATNAEISSPQGLAVDANGNIYLVDYGNSRIRKVDTLGIISTIAGTGVNGQSANGSVASSAELNFPSGVLTDNQGNIYISDESNDIIRQVNTSGIINTIAGVGGPSGYSGDGGPATLAELAGPLSIAFDVFGNLYIADEGNYRVRKVTNVGQMGIAQFANNNEQVNIYPNPAKEIINVELGIINSTTTL
ncbi:MAG: NHL domain-containing protein [Bacteroidia bacterium]